jgi:mannose-1-phosphate guanylyltransferase/phosphomannomutase
MKGLLLCAGAGTRLGALTRETPKAMLEIDGEPLIAHNLRYLAAQGVRDVAVNVHFRAERIADFVGDGSRFGVSVCIQHEASPLGTAGAVRRLAPFFSDAEDFVVVYGDLLIDQDLRPMLAQQRARRAAATLLLHSRPGSNSLVRMESDGRISDFVERPSDAERRASPYSWSYSGVQVLGPRLLAWITEHIADGAVADLPRDVYAPCLREHAIHGFVLTGYRCAIDSPERLEEARAAAASGRYRYSKKMNE